MKLVIDANIIFSCFIKNGKSSELLINPLFELYTPDFVFEEIDKYSDVILKKTHRTWDEFIELISVFNGLIIVISPEFIKDNLIIAEKICPDFKDVPYFALALKLNCPIWSNDKALKLQDIIKIYSTEELVRKLE